MKLRQMQDYIVGELVASDIDSNEAASMARLLLCHKLAIDLPHLPQHYADNMEISDIETELNRLKDGEPLQYITGETEFMGLPLFCAASALIPRGDSEVVAELAIKLMKDIDTPLIADVCTGSGAYALALAANLPKAQIWAVDIDSTALELAAANAKRLQLESRINFLSGDLLAPLQELNLSLHMIVSNPPYISSNDLLDLPPQVQREPAIALDGGADGLFFYRRLAADAASLLVDQGLLLMEHGADQAEDVTEIMLSAGFKVLQVIEDYGKNPRGTLVQK